MFGNDYTGCLYSCKFIAIAILTQIRTKMEQNCLS